ncbi:Crp/Fnr family transcriptional regulator, partial [Paenibacillus solani]
VVAAANAGKIGLDHWVLPYLRGLWNKMTHKTDHEDGTTHTPLKKQTA